MTNSGGKAGQGKRSLGDEIGGEALQEGWGNPSFGAMNSEGLVLLIVDDDAEIRYSLKRVLAPLGHRIEEAGSGEEGIEKAKALRPAILIMDNRMGGISGVEALQNIRVIVPQTMIILMTAYGTTQTAIEAMKYGAFDYILKPFEPEMIIGLVHRAVAAYAERGTATETAEPLLNSDDFREGIVGSSEAMRAVFKQIGQVTASDATVLITGESGTGKELVARCICQHSHRANKPFVAVNCAAIPENLIESELFGHEKGSFTGAVAQRIGRFEQCDGGTIFLDEIGDMALATQTKILRVLQEGEIQRVGSTETIKVDVRLVAATNKDVEEAVRAGDFREDLYYRLNVFRIRIPALRERPQDVPEIIDFHLQRLAKGRKIRTKRISKPALDILQRHTWPGNVRELENVIYRSAVVAQGEAILPGDLPEDLRRVVESGQEDGLPSGSRSEPHREKVQEDDDLAGSLSLADDLEKTLDRLYRLLRAEGGEQILPKVERAMIDRALRETDQVQAKAASILGLTKAALKKRVELAQANELENG
ncbi:MAG: sigma 54-interacting transcriptional regulator [Puniceicoccaceae bacterium]